jgi:SAM-dependent methyltransferase
MAAAGSTQSRCRTGDDVCRTGDDVQMSDLAEQVIGLYQRHGSAWVAARAAGSFVEQAWIDRFLAMVPRGAAILDLGCGAGAPIGRHLVDQGYSVTGVDSAPGMIAHFRANLPEQAALVGDIRHLALITRFAAILAWDSLFHLSHEAQRGMFPIF